MKTFVTILLGLCQFVTLSRQVVSKKHADDKFGVFDQENKRESVLLDKELETLILNQLDSKINDLEDIKVDAKILERHLDKHSNFSGYQSTRKTLSSIENDLIKAYQKELSMLKRKIIASNHKLGSKDMKEINRMIDNAEITVENSRDMIDSFIDVHLSSEEHEHEHDHEGDDEPHDDFADYSDLITNNTEATKDEEKILLDTINQELEELTDIEIHKEDLNDHLQEHQFIKLKDDEDAKAIIDQVSNEDIHKYKETLLEMRNQIKESKGHLNLEFVDKVVSMLDRANIFVEISKDRLVNADQLDLSNDINSIVQNMDETRELMDDGEHYAEVTGEEYLADEQNEEGIAQADIDDVVSSLDDSLRTEEKSLETDAKVSASEVLGTFEDYVGINTCVLLVIFSIILIVVIICLARKRKSSSSVDLTKQQSDKFHEIGGICSPPPDDRTLYNPNNMFDTPKVSKVREAHNINNNNAEAYKRK